MSVSPRVNSYTSRLQRVGSKRPKGTRRQTVHIYTSYSLKGTIYGVIWPYRYIKFCSLSCLHLGSGFESLLCRCLVSSLRVLGLLGTYEIKKKLFLQNSKQSWKNWVHPVSQWLQLFKPALSPITWSSVGLYQSLILLWLTFGPRFLVKGLQFIEVLQGVIS